MTKELIQRLRDSSARHDKEADRLCKEAADVIEALQAENERLESDLKIATIGFNHHRTERAALAAKLVPLEADAERYRAIRNGLAIDEDSGIVISLNDAFDSETLSGDKADSAIDAAKGGQHD